ncbi:methyltransferase domain-containing protein [Candidatus Woesebacteria bacterium]|nr:MAG: methyltransferase domain-containing protein [Candidatus Woesebacteria bacterium]
MPNQKINKKLLDILVDPISKRKLIRKNNTLISANSVKYEIENGVPVFTKLDPYLEIEAEAWEDEWQKGVTKSALSVYKKNMQIFKKLKFWEESGEAANYIPTKLTDAVLDIGCGNGVSTSHIRGRRVVGLELSKKQMIRAKEKFPNNDFVVGDARKLPFRSDTFDVVVAINILHHVADPECILDESYRVLKKGGILYTVDPNLHNPIGFTGRGLFKLLKLRKVFPTFPQFALGEDERQFTKGDYYKLFLNSKFVKWKIIPHRIERLLFFSTILIPALYKIPFYDKMLEFTSIYGNKLVKNQPFDRFCYFWKAEAIK